jgi:hypothetical protein
MIVRLHYNKNEDDGDLVSAHAPVACILFFTIQLLYINAQSRKPA